MLTITPCIKRKYANERSAHRKVSELRKKRRNKRGGKCEDHPYHCIFCKAWHLTSEDRS